jgi:Chloramphenicol phosphotransferase-like protein
MTKIVVSTLLKEDEKALFAQKPAGDWELPSEELGDQESTEDVVRRIARELLAIDPGEEAFLDTYYDRRNESGEPVIRNVYCLQSWIGRPRVAETKRYLDLRWVGLDGIGGLATSETQRAILRDCLAGSSDGSPSGAPITVITGPRGAGKSTIAGLICTRLQRAAHIEVDLLRDMVIASPELADSLEDRDGAGEGARLAVDNACALARNFSLSGYEAIIDDVIANPEALDQIIDELAGIAPLYFITLLPDASALESRDAMREPELRAGDRCLDMLLRFHRNGESRGLRLDTSRMSKSETVSWILANRDRARV